ncbi:MAG TPA: GNAT family N-acetyltransferase [Thermoplasmata archaeon]|nr:GNAT family N-acetyltransferase [Thermoplasmata archaeon]
MSVRIARTRREIATIRRLLREYREWLATDRTVVREPGAALERGLTRLDAEIEGLPGRFGPPEGVLLLVRVAGRPAGCAGVRTFAPGTAELKRVFVRPRFRGRGLGRALTVRALAWGRSRGFDRFVLDTLPGMVYAIQLYRSLGFRRIGPYWAHPLAEALFFSYRLT